MLLNARKHSSLWIGYLLSECDANVAEAKLMPTCGIENLPYVAYTNGKYMFS